MALRFRVAFGVIAVLFALSVVAGVLFYARLTSLDDAAAQNACNNELLGQFVSGLGRAFGSPPAPNPERTASVTDLTRLAGRFSRVDELCHNGHVPEFIPTPVK